LHGVDIMLPNELPNDKIGWRIKGWAQAAGISKATTAELVRDKRVESVKLGAARIILTNPAAFLASLKGAR
jgi:hypothetical protein